MSGAEAQIVVALDLTATELSGVVRLDGTDERRFVGWLSLLDALQRATGEVRGAGSREVQKSQQEEDA